MTNFLQNLKFLLLWTFFFHVCWAEESNLGSFRFKNMFLKGSFGTEENFIDNFRQKPDLSSWDSLTAQNTSNIMGLVGYKYRSSLSQVSYLGNVLLGDYRLISHAFKLQESIQFGRYALISSGGLFSGFRGNTIPDTSIFLNSRVMRLDGKIRIYLTKIVNTNTGYTYTVQNELNGEKNINGNFSHTVNYTVNKKVKLFVNINHSAEKLTAPDTSANYAFSLLSGKGGVRLNKYLKVFSGEIGLGMTLTQDGKIYTERNANPNISVSMAFEYHKIKQGILLFSQLVPTFNSDKQYNPLVDPGTINPLRFLNIIEKGNPLVQTWGTKLTTTYAFTRNLKSSFTTSWEKRNFPVGRREDILLGLQPRINFDITRFNSLDIFYQFSKNWSTLPEGVPGNYDYTLNQTGFKLLIKFSTERE